MHPVLLVVAGLLFVALTPAVAQHVPFGPEGEAYARKAAEEHHKQKANEEAEGKRIAELLQCSMIIGQGQIEPHILSVGGYTAAADWRSTLVPTSVSYWLLFKDYNPFGENTLEKQFELYGQLGQRHYFDIAPMDKELRPIIPSGRPSAGDKGSSGARNQTSLPNPGSNFSRLSSIEFSQEVYKELHQKDLEVKLSAQRRGMEQKLLERALRFFGIFTLIVVPIAFLLARKRLYYEGTLLFGTWIGVAIALMCLIPCLC